MFCHVMIYSYFSISGQFYKKINGVPMGLLLSPIINSTWRTSEEKA